MLRLLIILRISLFSEVKEENFASTLKTNEPKI